MSRSSSRSSMIALSYVRSKPRRGLMKRQNIQPESLSKRVMGGHVLYSHVVVVEGRKTIFVAGQLARGPSGDVVGAGDMRAQLRQVGENIKAALAAAGATLADIVKTNTYVTDIEEFFKHVDVRMEYFGALPTSTTVEVRKLAHPDLLVEVEASAVGPDRSSPSFLPWPRGHCPSGRRPRAPARRTGRSRLPSTSRWPRRGSIRPKRRASSPP